MGEINILCALLFSEKGKVHLSSMLAKKVIRGLDLKDKRHIHILLTLITYEESVDAKNAVLKQAMSLAGDNYGKYLLSFYLEDVEGVPESEVYNRINHENRLDKYIFDKSSYLYGPKDSYKAIIYYLMNEPYANTTPSILSLKKLIHEQLHGHWSVAFNQLQNLFHEMCKQEFGAKDDVKVNELIKKIQRLTPKEELTIIKFYHRRNFNPVSHPSMDGMATEEVTESEFKEYSEKIFNLIVEKVIS